MREKALSKLLLVGHQHGLAAHVGAQDLGDGDAAIGLQVVLEESDQHTRRGHAGVVQGVGQLGLAVLILKAGTITVDAKRKDHVEEKNQSGK